MTIRTATVLVGTLLCLMIAPLSAQVYDVPQTFLYSSTLPESQHIGTPHGLRLTARIYQSDTATFPIWTESFNATPDEHLRVSILLGSTGAGLPAYLFSENSMRWISLQVDGSDETPRVALVSVPYALKARDADTVGGYPASAFLANPIRSGNVSDSNSRMTTTGTTTYSSVASGALNMVPKFISSVDLGSSQITDTGFGVGLGNSSPQEMLDVQGRALLRSTSRGPAGLWFGTNDSTSPFLGLSAADQAAPFIFSHGGAARLTITSTGQVGIGVPSPTAALDVKGDVRLSSGALYFSDGTWLSSASGAGGGGSGVAAIAAGDPSITITKPSTTTLIAVSDQGITSNKLGDGVVTTQKLADASITAAKFAPGALAGLGLVTTGANVFVGQQSTLVTDSLNYAVSAVNKSTTGNIGGVYGETASSGGIGIKARATSTTGNSVALYALTDAPTGSGVLSIANSSTGYNYGVYGQSRSTIGTGVRGETFSTSGTNFGVFGQTAAGNYSAGVYGYAASTAASTLHYGVYGKAEGINGIGVLGYAPNQTLGGSGMPIGVVGSTESTRGAGGQFINSATSGNVIVAQNGKGNVWRVDNLGNEYVNGIVHAGGADFAESIQPSPSEHRYEPGDILAIATSNDRQVELSSEAYSTRVIGVFATKPGVLASRHGLDNDATEIPVAMIGIVPAKASAENGPILRGDLLVSAATPGYLMLGSDRQRLAGAVVGKAMQSLESGSGVIEIAVTLQ